MISHMQSGIIEILLHRFGMSRRSPASIDRQNTDTSGSGKSTPSWQRSEDSIVDQMGEYFFLAYILFLVPQGDIGNPFLCNKPLLFLFLLVRMNYHNICNIGWHLFIRNKMFVGNRYIIIAQSLECFHR